MMDNLHVNVTAPEGPAAILHAVELLMVRHRHATHYQDKPATEKHPRRLVFYWTGRLESVVPLPVPLDAAGVAELVQRWLDNLADNERGGWLDMDGDCRPEAFCAYNEEWGHVDGQHEAFMAVYGTHAWYGK